MDCINICCNRVRNYSKKINECRGQLLQPSGLEEDNVPDLLVPNTNIFAEDIVKHIKLINETECPELLNVEVPKVLGDILEAIVGAVFIDSKMDLQVVWSVYTRLFPLKQINKVIEMKPKHPVAVLGERFPTNVKYNSAQVSKDGIVSIVVEVTIDDNGTKEKFKFKGLGRNGKSAKYGAAKCALREFEKKDYRKMIFHLTDKSSKRQFGNLDWLLKPDINAISTVDTEEKLQIKSTIPNLPRFCRKTLFDNRSMSTTPPAAHSCDMGRKQRPISPKRAKPNYVGAQAKNPISKLQEECQKLGWPMPKYSLVHESGAQHEKKFVFEVVVNFKNYRPSEVSNTKQATKAIAADYVIKILKL